jgi:hypothetical protein
MRIAEENWKVLASLFPAGWQQMAWQSGAVERLRGFPSPDVLLRVLMLHFAILLMALLWHVVVIAILSVHR